MASNVVLKALGLSFQPNQLEVPDGSLIEANNVDIRRDNSVQPRRGFKLDGDSFGDVTMRLKQLFVYKERLIRQYADKLQFENGQNNDGTRRFSEFSGNYVEAQTGLRTKSIESNGNLYFTSSEGIKKISAKNAEGLSTAANYITNAGGIKAIDVEANLDYTAGNQTGFLPEDSAVAYRVVWAKYDANDNLILGTPSERTEIYNPIAPLISQDFARILGALDNLSGGLINDGDYVDTLVLPYGASASELRANVLSLAQKLDEDILYANDSGTGAVFNIDGGASTLGGTTAIIDLTTGTPSNYFAPGSRVFLKNFVTSSGDDINGMQVITAVTDGTPSISFASTATGSITTVGEIVSGEYRYIAETGTPEWPVSLDALVISTIPTYQEQKVIQVTLERILFKLQTENTYVIPTIEVETFLDPIDITTSVNVKLNINIPNGVGPNDFFQVYRSAITQATGVTVLFDLTPNDEMQMVYEAYPTAEELLAKEVVVVDITPDAFRGANLYTNEATGEGALAANDVPPFAKDINYFRNSVFYANTRTKHRKLLSMIGVDGIIQDYNDGLNPHVTISDGDITETYYFVTGQEERTEVECVADSTNSLNGKYFLLNSAYDLKKYYVWYKTSTGAESDPEVPGRTGIKILIQTDEIADDVAEKTGNVLKTYISDFAIDVTTDTITIINTTSGPCSDAGPGDSGFNVSITQNGRGEDASNNEVLLSTEVSPAIAVDETSRSLIRVINKNSGSKIYAYYLSGAHSVPGQMLFESKLITNSQFFIIGSSDNVGKSFSPDIGPMLTLQAVVAGTPTTNLITTTTNHGLDTGDKVVLTGTTTTPVIDGVHTVTKVSNTTFRINSTITVGDSSPPVGVALRANDAESSENEEAVNRVYYSKQDQPEAVPIVNYFNVGAGDKQILRILPLRDSLFVFKEDGLYRISGEVIPFSQALFDNSCILLAPDSLEVCNGELYGWTTQGISKISEGGVTPAISRPIDTEILKLASSKYRTFKTTTFGIGYESENSYLVWTVSETTDEVATICYRYNALTQTWTTYDKTNTCGIVNHVDDKLYLGAGDTNYMEQERKEFDRTDYVDREFNTYLAPDNYLGNSVKLASIDSLSVGDVFVQRQMLTIADYNALLEKIDLDLGFPYYYSFSVNPGDDLRSSLLRLTTEFDNDGRLNQNTYNAAISAYDGGISSIDQDDELTEITTSSNHNLLTGRMVTIAGVSTNPDINGSWKVTVTAANKFTIPTKLITGAGAGGTWATETNSFDDLQACFNIVVSMLNNDSSLTFTNYKIINDVTEIEAVITEINKTTNRVTLSDSLPFVVGDLTVYKAFESSIQYTPQTMGDPLGYKQVYEATVMFENKNFTQAKLGFSTDLLPERIDVPFSGRGNGIFGMKKFGGGFFGGMGGSGPFRTYVPRQCQRCRYVNVRFSHKVAREYYTIFGITLTGNISQSTRPYRS